MVFETPRLNETGKPTGRWDVCYRGLVRLHVNNMAAQKVSYWDGGSMGDSQNTHPGRRARSGLQGGAVEGHEAGRGAQFGLSLYSKGWHERSEPA